MLETFSGNFEYQKLTPEEQKARGILGTLYGPIADTKKPTRNGRLYPREAWEQAINDPIFQEQLNCKAILGELEHPTDRDAIDPTKACMCLAETPKIGKDGLLYGTFHILDLPNGRILKTYCDYGTKIGVSSRGNGDLMDSYSGDGSTVNPDSFELTCWDAVILPAVKEARMNYVAESLGSKSLNESLNELVNKSQSEDKEIMQETLERINKKLNEDINTKDSDNIKTVSIGETKNEGVENNVPSNVMSTLKESIKSKVQLETKVKQLQEELAISNTKAKQLEEELQKYKEATIRLSKIAGENKNLNKENDTLKETIERQEKTLKLQNQRISSFVEKSKSNDVSKASLQETLSNKDNTLKKLQEELDKTRTSSNDKINKLNESIEDLKLQLGNQAKDYSNKMSKASKLIEKYKGFVTTTVDRYIEKQALVLGVSVNEIKNRLSESYTLDEVDKVCEELQTYNLRISKLPFTLDKGTKISIKESKQSPNAKKVINVEDDCSNLDELIKTLQ